MTGFGIIMIIFGFVIMLAGLYLVRGGKGDFTEVLLWKSNVKKMTVNDIKYAGKVTIGTSLAPIISGIIAIFFSEESVIPIIILGITLISFLIISIKIFK